MTILEDLFYGNIEILGRKFPKNSRMSELLKHSCRNDEEFRKSLSEDLIDKFDKYLAVENQLQADFECEAFVCGFSLGIRRAFESLNEDFS